MGSIGFFEILLVLTVALLVLGPAKLLVAARYMGLTVRKGRSFYTKVIDEFDKQLRLDETIKNSGNNSGKNSQKSNALNNARNNEEEKADSSNDNKATSAEFKSSGDGASSVNSTKTSKSK